jgi:transcriptional regulator with XRE-family HTH domain
MNYGKAIKTIRAVKGLEQKELATLAELNPSYISLIEANRRAPSPAALEALAKALQVPLYLLMLLASDKEDLHGISAAEATLLGRQLLDVVLQANGPRKRAVQPTRAKR